MAGLFLFGPLLGVLTEPLAVPNEWDEARIRALADFTAEIEHRSSPEHLTSSFFGTAVGLAELSPSSLGQMRKAKQRLEPFPKTHPIMSHSRDPSSTSGGRPTPTKAPCEFAIAKPQLLRISLQ